MSAEAASRVEIVAVGACAADTMIWRMRGELRVSVIVKTTFAFQADAPMRVMAPEEIVTAEVHHARNPSRSVRLTTDLLPYLPAADVILTGHACAPEDETSLGMSVRLAVYREQALFDKSINVLCSTTSEGDVPFDTMPIVYERAYGGVGFADNPFGVGAAQPAGKTPNLVDPNDPERVACFGPIARGWPNRRRLLGKVDRRTLEAAVCEIPDGFNFAYFQAAPQDQQVGYLQGNEWVVLEGMHRVHTQICSCLPSAMGRARVFGVGAAGQGRTLALVADTLRIDADTLTCSVVWRGSFAVTDASALERIVVHAGVDTADKAVEWPPPPDIPAPAPVAAAPPPNVAPAPAAAPIGAQTQPSAAPQAAQQPTAPAVPARQPSSPGFPAVPAAPARQPSSPGFPAVPAAPARQPSSPGFAAVTAQAAPAVAASASAAAGGLVDGSTTAPSATPVEPPTSARPRKSWDRTVEIGDQEAPKAPAVPFRKGPVNLPARTPAPQKKPDFSATVATLELGDHEEKSPPTLPFQRQQAPAYARSVPRQAPASSPRAPSPPQAPSPSITLDAPVTPLSPTGPGAPPLAPQMRSDAIAPVPPAPMPLAPVVPHMPAPVPPPPPSARGLEAPAPAYPDLGVPDPAAAPYAPSPAADASKKLRTPEGIEIVNETPLVLGTVRWDHRPSRCALTVFAKATCDLVADAPAAFRASAEQPSGGRAIDGPRGPVCVYPSDLAPFKVRADVALVGHAHAPAGGAAEMEVRFKFGDESRGFDRKLLVLGDRTWQKAGAFLKPSAPARFLQLPLTLDRAFGGRGFDKNPVGLGFSTGMQRGPVPLPNLEDPNQRVRTPKQAPDPACFAPLHAREPRNGADPADKSLPERFDWTRHQAAPPEQRLPFLRGDEPFEIAGLYPKHPVFKGSLPGVAVRCFAERPSGREEVPMRLDTAFFDLDEKTLTLVWRGVLPVADERHPDVRSLRLVTAPIGDDVSPDTL